MTEINYTASPTMVRFHNSDAFVRSLFGPIGSGKSVACVIEMLRISFQVQEQLIDPRDFDKLLRFQRVLDMTPYLETSM